MLALPNRTPGLLEQVGLTREQVDAAAWTVDARGNKLAGAAGVNRALRELGGAWSIVARGYSIRPLRWLEDLGYAWVARNRRWLGRLWGDPVETA